jgi:hypothetical protein
MTGGTSRGPGIRHGAAAAWAFTAAAVLVLVGAVAVASSGSTPSGTDDVRPPSRVLVDTFVSLGMVLVIPGIALLVYGLTQRKAIRQEIASGRYPRSGFATFAVLMAAFGIASYFRLRDWQPGAPPDSVDPSFPVVPPTTELPPGADAAAGRPQFEWIPVGIVVGIAALAIAAFVVSERRRRHPPILDEQSTAGDLADALDDGLDDLRAEPDPRRAVVAAFARLEKALAAVGLPRDRGETSEEYVTRVFVRLDVDRAPVRRLAELYADAKFSHHPVGEGMKEDAIASLVRTRDELRALHRRRMEERAALAESPSSGEASAR